MYIKVLGVQGRCKRRSEKILKLKKNSVWGEELKFLRKNFFFGGGWGQGRCERRSEVLVKIQKKRFFFFFFFFGGGGWGGGQGRCERRNEFL